MRISHEAIYQALFVQSRGALRRELTACLRTGRVLRMPRARTRGRGKTFISPEIMISQRPAEAADRAVPGHGEGDLILGLGSSAIGTLVERMTRFTLLLHLPRMTDHGHEARAKNGPALAGHGAEAVCDAITRTMITLPEQLRRSLTWDQGAEMAQHARLKIDAGIQVYFCDPHSPWQRGTNENTNGLLRQYFPKGTDLSMHSADDIAAVAAALNTRPRKTLAEALDQLLISAMSKRRPELTVLGCHHGFGCRLSGSRSKLHSSVRLSGPFLGADLPLAECRAQVLSRMPLAAPARSAGYVLDETEHGAMLV